MWGFKRLLGIFLLLHLPISSTEVITRDFIIENFKPGICKRGTDDAIFFSTSYSECILECRARSQCVSVSYLSRGQMCRLNFDSADQTTNCDYYSYTEKADWNQEIKNGCESMLCANNQRCEITGDGPVCVNTECRRITSIENGVVYGNDVRKGKKVAFACNSGYGLNGSTTLTCTADGIWSDAEPVCADIGLWQEWTLWGLCSVTCGTGTRSRTRDCIQNLPTPCTPPGQETEECNTVNCVARARTCAALAALGLNQTAYGQIDPLGTGDVTVYCDFDLEPGRAVTTLRHNKQVKTHVIGYEECGSYSVDLQYNIGLEQVKMVADLSAECKQYIKWDCHATTCMYWKNRNGTKSTFFTGSPPPGNKCACGETNSCARTDMQCNCNMNDDEWRADEGNVADKNVLPITGFFAGDTGNSPEEGYHTIGPLLCS